MVTCVPMMAWRGHAGFCRSFDATDARVAVGIDGQKLGFDFVVLSLAVCPAGLRLGETMVVVWMCNCSGVRAHGHKASSGCRSWHARLVHRPILDPVTLSCGRLHAHEVADLSDWARRSGVLGLQKVYLAMGLLTAQVVDGHDPCRVVSESRPAFVEADCCCSLPGLARPS